ncbi:MAG TPA: hypothetical protein VMU95_16870 [Trebonia sp.]|nr:hypothetical protein [Trebonia sp.]
MNANERASRAGNRQHRTQRLATESKAHYMFNTVGNFTGQFSEGAMDTAGINLEALMVRFSASGVTIVLKADHERMLEGGKPWTIVMSGPCMGDDGGIHTDKRTLNECLAYGISELRTRRRDWTWLDEYQVDLSLRSMMAGRRLRSGNSSKVPTALACHRTTSGP